MPPDHDQLGCSGRCQPKITWSERWRVNQPCLRMDADMRTPALREALDDLAGRIARGQMLADAYWRALGLDQGRRQAEVTRVRTIILSAVGRGSVE